MGLSLTLLCSETSLLPTQSTYNTYTIVLLCGPVPFADDVKCRSAVVQYGFPVLVVVATMLIAHILCSDCKDTSCTVLVLYHCVTGGI